MLLLFIVYCRHLYALCRLIDGLHQFYSKDVFFAVGRYVHRRTCGSITVRAVSPYCNQAIILWPKGLCQSASAALPCKCAQNFHTDCSGCINKLKTDRHLDDDLAIVNERCGLQLQHVALYFNAAVAFRLAGACISSRSRAHQTFRTYCLIIDYAFMDAFEVMIISLGTQSSHLYHKSCTGEQSHNNSYCSESPIS
jgi:hypothetical protein